MIEIIPIENDGYWDEVVSTFPNHDIYYLSGYLKAFQAHGDGKPILFWYKDSHCQSVCVMFKRDVSNHFFFKNHLPNNVFFDMITPYGYGGFIFMGNVSSQSLNSFKEEYNYFLRENNIISSFTRYHPQLKNVDHIRSIFPIIDLGNTIDMPLGSLDEIWNNISSKNRNMIRKAQKSGVTIHHNDDKELLHQFKIMYNATMLKDNADEYYFFNDKFYDSIYHDLSNNFQVFYAFYENKLISMSIFIYANNKMHYHLSGSELSFRHLAPTNLLIYEAACWGHKQGFKTLHLGGGIGSGEDNLYKFKKAFNPFSRNQFSIGKNIVDNEKYMYLEELRRAHDTEFNQASSFFPVYRS